MQIECIKGQDVKTLLGVLIKNRKGYQKDLLFSTEWMEKFKRVGFINTGQTLQKDTYSVTKIADCYYKEMYGYSSYLIQRIKGFINFHMNI